MMKSLPESRPSCRTKTTRFGGGVPLLDRCLGIRLGSSRKGPRGVASSPVDHWRSVSSVARSGPGEEPAGMVDDLATGPPHAHWRGTLFLLLAMIVACVVMIVEQWLGAL